MLNLRYGLLVTVLGHFLVPRVIGSAIVEDCEPSTPLGVNSQEMFKDKTTQITPGKRVARIQAIC